MRSFKFSTKPLCAALITALLGGALFSLDAWTFGKWIDEVGKSYEGAGSFDLTEWIASVIYGGIVEEVLMRLFLMSLLAFIMWKLFYKKENSPPSKALITANIVSALLFAAGHLPSTLLTFGTLTPLLLLRCFLLNGAFGLIFGYFYRKHGIQYSMLLHMLFHIVSRSIWMIAL
ncbi:MAG: CPBP family intramembrane metalloprotease [Ruminococcaceae bacterium]|nr:CPBP family intramembrane metalloprotease [Oscillospiraceae bacterium]